MSEKMILGTNKAGLKEIQKRNGYTILGFIGMCGLVCIFCGAIFAGIVTLLGSGFGIWAIKKYSK